MKTQELKQYIDRVLGNSIRCLLPSYWWKRAFGAVIDNTISKDEVKTINGESILGEGNLKVGVTTVGSIDELNALEAEVGDIATATREAEKFVGVGTLLQYEDGVDYNSLFKVKKVSISVPKTSIGELSLVHLSTREGNITLTIVCSADGKDGYIQAWYEDGRKVDLMREQTLVQSNIDDLNSYLSKNVVRYISAGASSGSHFEFIDTWFKVATPYTVADAYIKGDSWERLAKERDLVGIEGGSGDDVNEKIEDAVGAVVFYVDTNGGQLDDEYIAANAEQYKRLRKSDGMLANRPVYVKNYDGFLTAQMVVIDAYKKVGLIFETYEGRRLSVTIFPNGTYSDIADASSSSGAEIREFYIGDSLTDEQKAWNLETAQAILDKKAIVICNGSILGDGITTNNDGSKEFINSAPTPQGVLYAGVKVEEDGTASVFFRQLYLDDKLSDKSISAVQNKVITAALNNKADKSDIKTINGVSLLGGGDITISGGGVSEDYVNTAIANAITTTLNTAV